MASGLWDLLAWKEQQTALHEEIRRLPEEYGVPVVLCDLQGRTHEAARSVQWPNGTVNGRPSRAPHVFRACLQDGKLATSTAVCLAALSLDLKVPEALVRSTVEAAMRLRRTRRRRSRTT
jgi:RNA polymerase sigma-70 factor (ECF subfamily)